MKIRAILTGATGMVGEGVLHIALESPDVESVLVVGRRPSGVSHTKLKEVLTDNFLDLSPLEEQMKGYNACFFCLGISSIGVKEEDYRITTYDITMHMARTLSSLNPDMAFCYVSGQGTDSSEKGRQMWARVKGKTENDIKRLPLRASYMFRPGFIKPLEGMKRTKSFAKLPAMIYPLLESLIPQYVCTMEDLGHAMINVSSKGYSKDTLENEDIRLAARHQEK